MRTKLLSGFFLSGLFLSGLFLSAFLFSSAAAQQPGLKPPFATRLPDPKAAGKSCDSAHDPVIGFDLASKYGASGRSSAAARRDRIDEDAEAAFETAMQPIRDFMGDVVKSANDYHRTGRVTAAECAFNHLRHWAKADALSAPESHTSYFKLATTLAGLSSAFLQIEPALTAGSPDIRLVKDWMARRAQQLQTYFDRLKAPRSSRNNHRGWAGLAVASAGVAANMPALLDWGLDSYRLVVCQATSEGALPLEIERGSKAREYHFYALAALVPLAEIAARNGRSSHGDCQDALHRIARYSLRSIADPATIAAAAGVNQSGGTKAPSASRLTFLEPYGARFPDRVEPFKALFVNRPFSLTDLGGNQTLLYNRQ